MPEIKVVLVKPQSEGNIGAVARAMMNFGLEQLDLVRPECDVGLEARRRAMHAEEILINARLHESMEDSISDSDMVVGTSGVKTVNEKKFSRITITPSEFADRIREYEGKVALLFGQEDFGLDREAILKCDMLVTIPTSEKYPIMNISHAASIIFCEIFQEGAEIWKSREAEGMELSLMHDRFEELLKSSDYPKHKMKKTVLMFRRIMGRAVLSKWEYHTMMGVLKEAIKKLKNKRE